MTYTPVALVTWILDTMLLGSSSRYICVSWLVFFTLTFWKYLFSLKFILLHLFWCVTCTQAGLNLLSLSAKQRYWISYLVSSSYFKFDLTFQFLIMQFQTVTEHGHQFGSDDFKILPTIKGFINNNCTCKCNLEY